MTFLPPGPIRSEIAASALIRDVSVLRLDPASACHMVTRSPQDGIELLIWRGQFSRPVEMTIRDDSERIHFTCTLQGSSRLWFESGAGGLEHVLDAGTACIGFNPGCRGHFGQHGSFESVTVMVRPDLFAGWGDSVDSTLNQAIRSGHCFARCQPAAELTATAAALCHALTGEPGRHSPLWLLGQGLAMVGLVLEAHGAGPHPIAPLPAAERRKLRRAHERLLADLSQPPTIAELAREVNLSVLKLKRGFRLLFDDSVYGLFQRERMQEAHRRLRAGEFSVTEVASELGYTNASHFAAAFRKQFGVPPSALKRAP